MTRTFTCAMCGAEKVPWFYRGPIGHAPENVCFDCWWNHWGEQELKRLAGEHYERQELVFYLVAQGVNIKCAALKANVHRNTASRWLRYLKDNPDRFPEWVSEIRKVAEWVALQT